MCPGPPVSILASFVSISQEGRWRTRVNSPLVEESGVGIVLPDDGHGPIFGDMSGRFVETALTFLRDEWASQ